MVRQRQPQEATIPKPKATQAELDAVNGMALDPIIDALLEHLPPPGDYFAKEDRALWLEILTLVFNLIYDDQVQPDEPPNAAHPHGG